MNTTSQKISKRLVQYSALSIALIGAADSNGQIIYTDVNPDVGAIDSNYFLKMDNVSIHFGLIQDNNNLRINPSFVGANGVMAFSSGWIYASALDYGEMISSGQYWQSTPGIWQRLNYYSCNYDFNSNSKWCDVTDKYLGLRFEINGNRHYGWARLDVPLSPSTWVIKDYAYNASLAGSRRDIKAEGAPIMAGEGRPLSIDDNEFSKIKIVSLNKTIALYNLLGKTDYRLFSISGQKVKEGSTINDTHVIEVASLATGIYIVELKDANSDVVIRKKIIL